MSEARTGRIRDVMGWLHGASAQPRHETRRVSFSILDARGRMSGDVLTPEEIDAHYTEEFHDRLHSDKDVVVLVHGPPGSGKSTLILDRMHKLDVMEYGKPTEIVPALLASHIAFKPYQVPSCYRETPRYSTFSIDEAATAALMATGTFDPDQKDLVELINIVRAKNVALFIAIPDPSDLAKSFRARRADYRMEIPDYPQGDTNSCFVGQKVKGRKFFLDDGRWLGFSDDDTYNPITFHDYRTSSDPFRRALWDAYRPLKMANLENTVDDIEVKMRLREKGREERRTAQREASGIDEVGA